MDDAERALDLLLTRDRAVADELVQRLVAWTDERRVNETQTIEEAEGLLKSVDVENRKVLVVAQAGWNGGVVGLVATRILQRYHRPTLVLVVDEATRTAKGSGRSIVGFDLNAGLMACHDLLDKYGGHKGAAGMSLPLDNLPAFIEAINAYADSVLTPDDLIPKEMHDGVIDPCSVSMRAIDEWQHLAPFGTDNPAPRFAATGLAAFGVRTMGREKTHLQFRIGAERGIRCVGWGMAALADSISAVGLADLLFEPQIDTYNGGRWVELKLKACRPSGAAAAVDATVPDDLVDAAVDPST
jgi:single-stranded-DNA-specific exonuclease